MNSLLWGVLYGTPLVWQVKSSLNKCYHWLRTSTVQPANRVASSPQKQSSLFITGVNSSLDKAHRCKLENSLNIISLSGGLIVPCKQSLPLDLRGQLPLCSPGSGLISNKKEWGVFSSSLFKETDFFGGVSEWLSCICALSPGLWDWQRRGSDGQMVSVSRAFVVAALYLCIEWENNKRTKLIIQIQNPFASTSDSFVILGIHDLSGEEEDN